MGKVLVFPTKKELPPEILERLNAHAKDYVYSMNKILTDVAGDDPTEEEFIDVIELLLITYLDFIQKAIDES